MPGEWLSIREVAKIIGVHPSTVRHWSDEGHLPVHRTQGGHRRYRYSEVELWLQSHRADAPLEWQNLVNNALNRIRMQISEGGLEAEKWYQKLGDEARGQFRRSGRALMEGLIGFMSTNGEKAEAEGRSLGYEYASRGWRYGLSSAEVTSAFLFFRNILLNSMLAAFEGAAIHSPRLWGEVFRKISHFTDLIQLTLLETYDAYQRGNR